MTWCIYKIQNEINNRCYIGQSKHVQARFRDHKRHGRLVKEGKKNAQDNGIQVIHLAIAKYGVDNFTFKIIEEVDTQKEANEKETYWVSYYDSLKNGYNCTRGGFNAPKTEEWKRKVKASRMANGGYGHSEKTKQLLSERWYENHPPESIEKTARANRGRVTPPEVRKKLSKANKGKQNCLGQKQPQKVIDKRIATMNAKYGSKICNVPGCERTDGFKYEGKRYCNMHVERLKRNGTWNLLPRPKTNLGKKHSSEIKAKISQNRKGKCVGKNNPFYGKQHSPETMERIRQQLLGREPPNKIKFSEEDIEKILSDSRGLRKIAKDFGVSITVIKRIKRENNY